MRLRGHVIEEVGGERRQKTLPERSLAVAKALLGARSSKTKGQKARRSNALLKVGALPSEDGFERIAVVAMLSRVGLVELKGQ